MNLLYSLAGLMLLVGVPIYLHAVIRLHGIIATERSDWIASHRSESIFYTGMPSVADPNVTLAVVGFAFGSRWRSLVAQSAKSYVWRIRLLLPSFLAVFVGVLVVISLGAP